MLFGWEVVDTVFTVNSPGQPKADLAIYFLNGWTYDKSPTVSLIELRKTHILVLNILS
jgi:hypothetical protein